MTTDTPQIVSRSALRFFSGTLLSRISGMLRDMSMAFFFGTSPALAAFLLAYRFVYLSRRLFGEGLLHQGFIPHFEAVRSLDPKKGALFFRDLFYSLAIFLGGCLLIAEIGLYFVPGETARLAMWMLPGIFFICLFGLSTGLLQSEKHFFLSSVSPVAFNVVWILGVVAFRSLPLSQAVVGLSITLSFAFFMQWMMTVPKVWASLKAHLSVKELARGAIFSPELKRLIQPILLGVVGVAAVQINSAIDGVFARCADLEGPAYLWYAIRLQQLPLALFGIALASALLPSLSRAVEEGAMERYHSLIAFAKKQMFTLVFPCVIGIFVLGLASINLLFGRGDFGQSATAQTTLCLFCYGVGLLPAALVQILAPAFYSKKDYQTPTKGVLFAALLNIGLNALLVFVFKLGAASIALATSAAALFNVFYLSSRLGHKTESLHSIVRVGVCALLAGGGTLLVGYLFLGDATLLLLKGGLSFPREFSIQCLHFFVQAGVYFGIFFGLARLMRVKLYSSSSK